MLSSITTSDRQGLPGRVPTGNFGSKANVWDSEMRSMEVLTRTPLSSNIVFELHPFSKTRAKCALHASLVTGMLRHWFKTAVVPCCHVVTKFQLQGTCRRAANT